MNIKYTKRKGGSEYLANIRPTIAKGLSHDDGGNDLSIAGLKPRSLLKGAGALFLAPGIVRAESLMKLWVPQNLVMPESYYSTNENNRLIYSPDVVIVKNGFFVRLTDGKIIAKSKDGMTWIKNGNVSRGT